MWVRNFRGQYQRGSACNTRELGHLLLCVANPVNRYRGSILKQNPWLSIFNSISSSCWTKRVLERLAPFKGTTGIMSLFKEVLLLAQVAKFKIKPSDEGCCFKSLRSGVRSAMTYDGVFYAPVRSPLITELPPPPAPPLFLGGGGGSSSEFEIKSTGHSETKNASVG